MVCVIPNFWQRIFYYLGVFFKYLFLNYLKFNLLFLPNRIENALSLVVVIFFTSYQAIHYVEKLILSFNGKAFFCIKLRVYIHTFDM